MYVCMYSRAYLGEGQGPWHPPMVEWPQIMEGNTAHTVTLMDGNISLDIFTVMIYNVVRLDSEA